MCKKSPFRGPFAKQHARRTEALLKLASQRLDNIHGSLPRKLSGKMSRLLTWQVLGLHVNTLAADEK